MANVDSIRFGAHLYMDAITNSLIDTLDIPHISERLNRFHASKPLYPQTTKDFIAAFQADTSVAFALRQQSDDRFIGVYGLANLTWQARFAELRVGLFDVAHLRADVLHDAARISLQYAFLEANLNRIEAWVGADNAMWIDALLQAGFTEEGRIRQDRYRDGQYVDTVLLGVLRAEYPSE